MRVRLAWSVTLLAMTLLLAGGAIVAAAVQERPIPHSVLDVIFTTTGYLRPGTLGAGGSFSNTYELWTDPVLDRARLSLVHGQTTLFYVRSAGIWYSIGRANRHAPWLRRRVAVGGEPALLSEDAVRRLFAEMRSHAPARDVTPTALRHRMAVAFPAQSLAWPFRYQGRSTIWLDAVTGLPLQFRYIDSDGHSAVVYLTSVDQLRTVRSTSLPDAFLTPPDQQATWWDTLTRSIAQWIDRRLGRAE